MPRGIDWVESDAAPSVPFLRALAIGTSSAVGITACALAACQAVYALGWAVLQTTTQVPSTGWLFSSESDGLCLIAGLDVLIACALLFFVMGVVAQIGGWHCPESFREFFEGPAPASAAADKVIRRRQRDVEQGVVARLQVAAHRRQNVGESQP